jgi:hypothetical protein
MIFSKWALNKDLLFRKHFVSVINIKIYFYEKKLIIINGGKEDAKC